MGKAWAACFGVCGIGGGINYLRQLCRFLYGITRIFSIYNNRIRTINGDREKEATERRRWKESYILLRLTHFNLFQFTESNWNHISYSMCVRFQPFHLLFADSVANSETIFPRQECRDIDSFRITGDWYFEAGNPIYTLCILYFKKNPVKVCVCVFLTHSWTINHLSVSVFIAQPLMKVYSD